MVIYTTKEANKIYQEFQLLNLPEYLMDAMRQADHSRASRRGLLTNLGYVVDQLASLIKLRDNIVIHEGDLASLRRFKDDVKEVASGYECGVSLEKFADIKEGDILEAYTIEEYRES